MAGSLSGDILPPQVIYQDKTDQCHPKYNFPSDWHITNTDNHWTNTQTYIQYIEKLIVPCDSDKVYKQFRLKYNLTSNCS